MSDLTPTLTINWLDDTTRRWITGSVARPTPGDTRRRCFYVDHVASGPDGHTPSLVFEDEPGHSPMTGATPASTWYWGHTLAEAQAITDLVNAELFGLTPDDAMAIVGSSINAEDAEDEEEDLAYATDDALRDAAPAAPVLIAIDADCPACGKAERSYDPARNVFGCSSLGGGPCGYESPEREA